MNANDGLLKRRAANMRVTRIVAYPTLLTPNKLREMLEHIPSHANIIDINVSGIQHPSKKQIEQFRHRCADLYDPRFPRFSSIDRDARREIDKTVYDLDTVLQQWDLTEAFPLRFYPYKPDRFDRYSI